MARPLRPAVSPKYLLFLLALSTAAASPARAETPFEQSAREKQAIAKDIAWPFHEPLMFLRRRGGNDEDFVAQYERQHDPANIQRMADVGVRYTRLHFYKGFGLQAEMPEIRKAQAVADQMHRLGMKVSLYVAGTMFIETFYQEVPEAVNWEQRDQNNQPVPYTGAQTYRHFACRNEPAYRDYIKKVLRVGVQELKADEIFFDNVFEQPEPKSCRCPRCMAAFHAFLRERYPTAESSMRRFGYANPDDVRVSEWFEYNRPDQLRQIDDPVLQEWEAFRCASVARYCADLYDYVKSLNPNVAVGFNLKGIYGSNRIWSNAVYQPLFKGKIDFSPFDAGGFEPRIDGRTGALVTGIRSYKMARDLGYSYQTGGNPLEFAEYMAFNPQKKVPGFGYEGGPWGWGALMEFTPEAEFFRTYNDRYYTDTESAADIAVLHTWPAEAYNMSSTRAASILLEQVLIQHQLPFDLIFDRDRDQLARYQAVIVPGQESLAQGWVDRLVAFARGGGTVVFTGDTADYNEHREKRRQNPLRALTGGRSDAIAVAPVGQGKLVYIPQIVARRSARGGGGGPADETNISVGSGGRDLAPADWLLASNHTEIDRTIVGNLRDGATLETTAPTTVVAELLNRPSSSETLVHLINFDTAKPTAAFEVRVRTPEHRPVKSVTLLTPDAAQPRAVDFTRTPTGIAFTSPALRLYELIAIAYQ